MPYWSSNNAIYLNKYCVDKSNQYLLKIFWYSPLEDKAIAIFYVVID